MVLGFKKQFVTKILDGLKIHTIREDENERWKVGNKINFATGVRTELYFQFKQDVCLGIQSIIIKYDLERVKVFVDWEELSNQQLNELVKNDGFDCVADFFDWFNKDFTGKIIHWTGYKYHKIVT